MKRIHLFKVGCHTASNGLETCYSQDDLEAIAAAYDPDLHEAPLVVGHPDGDAPAYGWIERLEVTDEGLFGVPHQVNADFAKLVDQGSFKKISISLLRPGTAYNPTPDGYYLDHVGFLGAQAPAVKGLKPIEFAAGDATLDFEVAADGFMRPYQIGTIRRTFRGIRDWILETSGMETAERVIPEWSLEVLEEAEDDAEGEVGTRFTAAPGGAVPDDAPVPDDSPSDQPDDPDMDPDADKNAETTDDFAAREEKLSAREEELAAREKKIAEAEEKRRRAEAEQFAESVVGKILPRHKDTVVSALLELEGAERTVQFASASGEEYDEQPVGQALRAMLKELPDLINFEEVAAPEAKADLQAGDPDYSRKLARAAQDYQAEQRQKGHVVSISDAIEHVKDDRGLTD